MHPAKAPAKPGRPIDPVKRKRILDALTGDPSKFTEYGTPPYSVSDLAGWLVMDPSNLRKALMQMEAQRLVVRERRKMDVWNAIAQANQDRLCLCFWNAATQEDDRQACADWNAGARERSRAAFETLVGGRQAGAR